MLNFLNSNLGQTVISTGIPALVTIIGFVVTYFAMRRNVREEVKKQKNNIALEKMATVPYDVMQLYAHMVAPVAVENTIKALELKGKDANEYRNKVDRDKNNTIIEMKELFNTIYAYGSENAIRILATMQKHNYANSLEEKDGEAKNMLLAYYILLATQIRYDVTGEIINPLSWYEINITDFEKHKEEYKKYNNSVVNRLGLNKKMLA